jgi:cytochrome c peroxidase
VAEGEDLFFNETFGGNGRTCGTCHPTPTMALSPAAIAKLPPGDPFFAGTLDFDPDAAGAGLIRYPLGASLLDPDVIVFRGIPSIRNLKDTPPFTVDGRATTLREQATEAVLLHLLDGAVDRPGERLPTESEMDAIAAFQESVRKSATLEAGPGASGAQIAAGRRLFFGRAACAECHQPPRFTDNEFHNIVASSPGHLVPDPGRCRVDPALPDCWSGTAFNTPQLHGVGETAPFFHDNRHPTLTAVVLFYNSAAFSESPAAKRLHIRSLELSAEEVAALVAFLERL